MDELTRHKLVTAAIKFDERQEAAAKRSKRGYHNRYALGHYLRAIEGMAEDVAKGKSLARSLYDHANDRFLTALEKAVGVPVTYGGGSQDRGRPA
jgi:hypothetical protein